MNDPAAPLDPRRFRDTIGLFATGVAVIVARAADEVLAMTANAMSSASLVAAGVVAVHVRIDQEANRLV